MTSDSEKVAFVRTLCGQGDGVVSDGVVSSYLQAARDLILTRRYPFSDDPTNEPWEHQYDILQCEMANEMIARRGAEGEVTHTESKVSRQWVSGYVSAPLLARVIPKGRAIG